MENLLIGLDGTERRFFSAELRVDDPDNGIIEGYAAVFNQWSEDLGYFREIIRPGAFGKTVKEADVRALFNHDSNYVLGRNKSGTLELAEDEHGLQFRVNPPETGWAVDLRESIRRGDIDQASFGFQTIRDRWDQNVEPAERELLEVRLFDVSVVTYPAYPQTSVSARSLADMFIARVKNGGNLDAVDLMLDQLREVFTDLPTPDQEIHLGGELHDEADRRARLFELKKRRLELEKLRII